MVKGIEMNFRDKIVWITGASSGIGEGLLYELDRQGAKIIISSRKEESLKDVKAKCSNQDNISVLALDLSKHDELNDLAEKAWTLHGKIDVVILNGGISQRALAKDSKLDVVKQLMNVNYFGNVALTQALLPKMVANKNGHFVVVTSLTGKFGTPYRSAYAASKHACHGYFDSLRAEHVSDGIYVTIVCPGFIKTNISINALQGDGSKLGQMDDAQANGMPTDVFARKCLNSIAAKKDEVYIGGKELMGVYLKRFLPSIFNKMIAKAKVR